MFFAANPYAGQDFFGFFATLFQRIIFFLTQGGSLETLVSDEVQCVVLILLSMTLSLLGSFLVLKQMTMLANALSHTILLGIVTCFILFQSLFSLNSMESSFISMKVLWTSALISGLLTVLCTQFLTHVFRLQEDASIGLVFTTLFALGILLVTLYTKNLHLGAEAVMGNIDALHFGDIKIAGSLALGSLLVFLLFFKGFYLSVFDAGFAKSLGWPVNRLNYLLMVLTAGGAIASFRAVGVLLFLSFLVGPVLISLRWIRSLKKLIFTSFALSSIVSLCAVALSRHFLSIYKMPLSTSGLIVSLLLCLYLLVLFFPSKIRRVIKKV